MNIKKKFNMKRLLIVRLIKALFAPKSVGKSLAALDKVSVNLRKRAAYEREVQAQNAEDAVEIIARAEEKAAKLDEKNRAIAASVERAERVADRHEQLNA